MLIIFKERLIIIGGSPNAKGSSAGYILDTIHESDVDQSNVKVKILLVTYLLILILSRLTILTGGVQLNMEALVSRT